MGFMILYLRSMLIFCRVVPLPCQIICRIYICCKNRPAEIEDCDDAVEEFPEEAFADAHPELTCKMWLGWRTSYRTTAPEAKTFHDFRPRLQKIHELMGPRLNEGAQRHRRSSVVLGNFARNAKKKLLGRLSAQRCSNPNGSCITRPQIYSSFASKLN